MIRRTTSGAGTTSAMQRAAERRGATLVIVIALLGALLIMGMLVLTLASQEEINAEYFADSAKVPLDDLGPDVYFDFALRQIILGPHNDYEKQSALYGGRMSLLPTMLGRDMSPYDGGGVNVMWNSNATLTNNVPFVNVDMNNDGAVDNPSNLDLLNINNSPAAQGKVLNYFDGTYPVPEPDVAYTYPDVNSPFLAYDATAPAVPYSTGMAARVVLPSFHRPQFLRGLKDSSNAVIPPSQWYQHADTAPRVLRPHVEHRAIDEQGTVTSFRRFISSTYPDTTSATPIAAFPFSIGQQGVWSEAFADYGTYNFDADPDGDGVNDAIYLDLGFPPQSAGSNEWFVPIFSVTIKCADSLFNLNAHGNLSGVAGVTGISSVDPFGGLRATSNDDTILGSGDETYGTSTEFASRSNMGVGSHEVNPQWALPFVPPGSTSPSLRWHQMFFGHTPRDQVELANMEWLALMLGRVEYGSSTQSTTDVYPGRMGDVDRLYNASLYDSSAMIDPRSVAMFPRPGLPDVDDNQNMHEGVGSYHPLDVVGNGQHTLYGSAGRNRLMVKLGQHRWARYDNALMHPTNVYYQLGWGDPFDPVNKPGDPNLRGLTPLSNYGFQIDDAAETKLEPSMAQSDRSDAIFGAEEDAALHLTNNDLATLGLKGRIHNLAPVNFSRTDPNSEPVRRLFATNTWDLKAHRKPYFGSPATGEQANSFRKWEFFGLTAAPTDSDSDGLPDAYQVFEFPPLYHQSNGGLDPFRPELRELLRVRPDDPNVSYLKQPQGRLSVNQVLERGPDGRLRFRPLWPHPVSGLGNMPVRTVSQTHPSRPEDGFQNAADQEWLARRDRQKLCRDIYVLLYTLCGGNDRKSSLLDNSSGFVYGIAKTDSQGRGDQCRMMAQFAVNLVDANDPDDIMTVFEYDTNLANGWGLDDDPFTSGIASDPHDFAMNSERGVVYGVEEQQLAFTEAMAVWACRIPNDFNHNATEWDDKNNKSYLFMELDNKSPRAVSLGSQAWQISVKPRVLGVYEDNFDYDGNQLFPVNGADSGSPITGEERRLTLTSGTVNAGTNSLLSLFTDNAADTDPNDSTVVMRSTFKVNPHHGHSDTNVDTGTKYVLAPRSEATADPLDPSLGASHGLKYDLIKDFAVYRVNHGSFGSGDGNQVIGGSANNPASRDLLHLDLMSLDDIDGTQGIIEIDLELRRRLNPYRGQPAPNPATDTNHPLQSADNPWVVVDRIRIPLRVFKLGETDNYDQIRGQIGSLRSSERSEPLNRGVQTFVQNTALYDLTKYDMPDGVPGENDWKKYVLNSIGSRNLMGQPTPPTNLHNLWQQRFDRDFGSVVELFQLPLYGPDELTKRLAYHTATTPPIPDTSGTGCYLAGYMFLHPLNPSTPSSAANPDDFNNRWARLLEFVEVPSRWHRHNSSPFLPWGVIDAGRLGGNPLGIYRRPGMLQLNTLSHPAVLGGLIDDRDLVQPFQAATLGDWGDSDRDWWVQFLWARDGGDPYGTNLILPGLPPYYGSDTNRNGRKDSSEGELSPREGSRPFRAPEYSANGVGSLEDTIFRLLPRDAYGTRNIDPMNGVAYPDPRQLFEIGRRDYSTGGRETIDYTIRDRILGKVANHTTTRSNVFLVFIQVDFFEAAEVTVGGSKVYRVGAKRSDSPAHRGFFVVDRSRAMELLSAGHLPPFADGNPTTYSFNQSFNFRSLILHRQTIR